MVRSVVFALVVSIAVCAVVDFKAQRSVARVEQELAAKQAELKKLEDIDRQVQAANEERQILKQRRALIDEIKRSAP